MPDTSPKVVSGFALLTRRCLAACIASLVCSRALAETVRAEAIAAIEDRHGGRLGVFAQNLETGRTVAYRANERFLLESIFKGPLAALILQRIDRGEDRLDDVIEFGVGDIIPASPVTSLNVQKGKMTLRELTKAVLERSDNTAANLLLRRVGGPSALTAWLRDLGDTVTRIDRYELIGGWSGMKDTTTPRVITETATKISIGDVLKPETRALNNRWMAGNVVGVARLRHSFPSEWPAFDRTGTSDSVCNDYMIVSPPGRKPIVAAAFYERPDLRMEAGGSVLREVGTEVRHLV